jgi:hypothetical protein
LSILVDRSRIETDWACPRKRYWLTEHGGGGIVPAAPSPAFAFGIAVHLGLEYQILENTIDSHDEWVPSMDFLCPPEEGGLYMMQGRTNPPTQDAGYPVIWDSLTQDMQDTATALLTGFFQSIWPRWMDQFEPMAVEQELEFEQDGVLFMARPDLLLKDKKTGDIWYPDFKTFSTWNNRKWDWGLQQQLTMLACERALGITIRGAWIQGLLKGTGRKGVLYHPLVYGYRHPGTPGVTDPTYGSKRRSGFERFNTKDYPRDGIAGWVKQLAAKDPDLLAKCYPQTAPIFLKRELLEGELLPQIVRREQEIHRQRSITDEVQRMRSFPMNITQCETGYGRCAYFEACHVSPVKRDPLRGGLYDPRIPHHAAERTVHELHAAAPVA